MNGIPKSWGWGFLVVGLALFFVSGNAPAAMASTQARDPWSIAQCDRLVGRRASAVFNTSTWSYGGWPLWRVVCVYYRGEHP